MELEVKNIKGEATGKKINLSKEIFGIEPNDHAIYLDVKRIRANQRQGTHKAKERAEIAGSTKKLRKQKGGGSARIGDIKSPILRGGGRIFGPRPRDYGFKLNKKVRQLARRSALAYKAKNNEITLVEEFSFDSPKTKQFVEVLEKLNMQGKKSLLVLNGPNDNVLLSARNLPNIAIVYADQLNTYSIMNCNSFVMIETAIDSLTKSFEN